MAAAEHPPYWMSEVARTRRIWQPIRVWVGRELLGVSLRQAMAFARSMVAARVAGLVPLLPLQAAHRYMEVLAEVLAAGQRALA